VAAAPGPPGRDDPHWAVGDRRDGWLKVGPDTYVRGGRLHWLAVRAGLTVLGFVHLGRRPVLGPPLPLHPPGGPYAVLPGTAAPVGARHALRWVPAEGARARLLRWVPRTSVVLTALVAYSGGRRLTRPRMAAGHPGRGTA
jgi:hypothetical protein